MDLINALQVNTLIRRIHKKGEIMNPHFHHEWEIISLKEGSLEIIYYKDNIQEFQYLRRDQIAIIKPNLRHYLNFLEDSTLSVLEIDEVKNNSIMHFVNDEEIHKNYPSLSNSFYKLKDVTIINDEDNLSYSINELINTFIYNKENPNDLISKERFNNTLKIVLLDLHKCIDRSPSKESNVYINKCSNYIYEHLHEDINVEEISDYVGITSSYLERIFKENYDTTIYKFIKNKRIDYAKNLLITTSLNYKSIALKSGFKNYVNLYKTFIYELGISPKDYRLNNSNKEFIQFFNNDFHD